MCEKVIRNKKKSGHGQFHFKIGLFPKKRCDLPRIFANTSF